MNRLLLLKKVVDLLVNEYSPLSNYFCEKLSALVQETKNLEDLISDRNVLLDQKPELEKKLAEINEILLEN